MSNDFVQDIAEMHNKFGANEAVRKLDPEKLKAFVEFRLKFLDEELDEGYKAFYNNEHDDFVDSMIDLIVVAIGTLDALDVNTYEAWDRVLKANLAKEVGIKPERPNPLGLPDLIKPKGWVGPEHKDNIGLLEKVNV